MTKAAANQAVKKYVFWQGDGTEASDQPVFYTGAPLLPLKKLQVADRVAEYRADRVTDRVAESSRMQGNLSGT